MEKSKDMENVPFIVLKRIDCSEQKTKTGETYYMFNGLYVVDNVTYLVPFFTRDKDLYSDVLAIPANKEFKLYYELKYSNQNGFRVSPLCVSL